MKYSKEQLVKAVQNSKSIADILRYFNLTVAGGNYRVIKKYIKLYNINISHFTGQAWNKNYVFGPKRPIEDYLSNRVYIQSNNLKYRLIKEGLLEHKCSNCKLLEWLNEPIPIELDHIDGNHENNNLSNLRILCPNCHAKTENYRGKNIVKQNSKTLVSRKCCDCNKKCCNRAIRCKSCASILKNKKYIKRPTIEELKISAFELRNNFVQLGKKYGVTDNAVRSWYRFYNLDIPKRGFYNKDRL